jgi:hypothetical protein
MQAAMGAREVSHVNLNVVPVIGRQCLQGLTEHQRLPCADLNMRGQQALALHRRCSARTKNFTIKQGNALCTIWECFKLYLNNAKRHCAKAVGVGLKTSQSVTPRTAHFNTIAVRFEGKGGVLQGQD